ncbi:major facilitator superfamily transporter [Colletotrichum higginsianum]|uniref:Major facilitator superfamily transporter n=1 Tax=Colletotrichum higginsianum (strain IMI 349063) TaxID=759273 RepID=H1V9U1_COLHI|nr:Major facilitator superfamily transporter [Colletotrichum higginsianum IMI 349063]OBR10281.1 Major facilitator superfamily transporter [Colletotrichum higginsianum IMI 349063]GJD02705.1 major facilitator superfamily transporter [Colletotrichum higginsianum]CCF36994.1 major facilitator superfamily transporter [Colletotrichum higginsianum]
MEFDYVTEPKVAPIARFAEPLALTSVFPYLPEMISSFGVEQNDVAKWAGYTSAVFSLSQSVTAVAWGRASDRIGRKPAIIIGLISTMVFFVVWGMSTSLPMAIVVRAILGSGNGNVGIIRTMVAEMVPEKELQPRAFSIMPLIWSVGSIFGPAFGGFFANPARRFPALFGDSWFFNAYPFALPNLIAAVFFLISVATATLFLKETLESKRHKPDWGLLLGERLTRPFRRSRPHNYHHAHVRRTSFVDGEATAPLVPTKLNPPAQPLDDSKQSAEAPSMKEVFTAQTSINLLCYTFLALHSVAYDQILPVFLHHPKQVHNPENTHLPFQFSGGFGLSSDRIGTIFTIYGITCGVIQFFVFPPLCNYFGVLRCFRACAVTFPFVYILTPYVVLFESNFGQYAALMVVMFTKAFAVIIGFPCMTILLTNSASSLRILGTLNGFATMFSGFGRAFGPAAAGAAFSWGVARGYVIVAYWFLALTAVLGAIPVYMLFDYDALTQTPDASDDEEQDESVSDEGYVSEGSVVASGSGQGALAETAPLLGAKNGAAGYDAVSPSRS